MVSWHTRQMFTLMVSQQRPRTATTAPLALDCEAWPMQLRAEALSAVRAHAPTATVVAPGFTTGASLRRGCVERSPELPWSEFRPGMGNLREWSRSALEKNAPTSRRSSPPSSETRRSSCVICSVSVASRRLEGNQTASSADLRPTPTLPAKALASRLASGCRLIERDLPGGDTTDGEDALSGSGVLYRQPGHAEGLIFDDRNVQAPDLRLGQDLHAEGCLPDDRIALGGGRQLD